MKRVDNEAQAFIGSRIFSGQARAYCFDFGIGVLSGYAGFESRNRVQVVIATTTRLVRLHGPRNPQLAFTYREEKVRRHYTDNRERLAVERHFSIDYVRIAVETSLPKCVTQNSNVLVADLIFLRQERSSEHRLHTQQGKDVRGDELSFQTFRFAFAGEIHAHVAERAESFKDLILISEIEKVCRRHLVARDSELRAMLPNSDE